MILVAAVLIGLAAGILRARAGGREYRVFELRATLLVLVAFIPQLLIFFLPFSRTLIPTNIASILHITSLLALIVFSFFNIQKTSFWPIITGFLMNALVIVLNGGWMPISPDTMQKINAGTWQIGNRVGFSKDILLQRDETRLWFLSDRFTLPAWLNYQVAFSLGDIFIFVGIISLLWSLGGAKKDKVKE